MRINIHEHPWSTHCHVFLDGVDVSSRCVGANDEEGWCDLYNKDAEGRFVVNAEGMTISRHNGRVLLALPPDVSRDTRFAFAQALLWDDGVRGFMTVTDASERYLVAAGVTLPAQEGAHAILSA